MGVVLLTYVSLISSNYSLKGLIIKGEKEKRAASLTERWRWVAGPHGRVARDVIPFRLSLSLSLERTSERTISRGGRSLITMDKTGRAGEENRGR